MEEIRQELISLLDKVNKDRISLTGQACLVYEVIVDCALNDKKISCAALEFLNALEVKDEFISILSKNNIYEIDKGCNNLVVKELKKLKQMFKNTNYGNI